MARQPRLAVCRSAEETQLYRLLEQHCPALVAHLAEQGKALPAYVDQEFESYLKCGWLEHGLLRVRCESCHFERLVAFSCKKRGFRHGCGTRRMAEMAALLSNEVLPALPLCQRVISLPFAFRLLFASCSDALATVRTVICRLLATHLAHKAGFRCKEAVTGAVTLVQLIAERFERALWRIGLLSRDAESALLELPPGEDTDAMGRLVGSSVSYRTAPAEDAVPGRDEACGLRALGLNRASGSASVEAAGESVSGAKGRGTNHEPGGFGLGGALSFLYFQLTALPRRLRPVLSPRGPRRRCASVSSRAGVSAGASRIPRAR